MGNCCQKEKPKIKIIKYSKPEIEIYKELTSKMIFDKKKSIIVE